MTDPQRVLPVGELRIRRPNVKNGYWNRDEARSE